MTSQPWVHPASDPNLQQIQYWPQNGPRIGLCHADHKTPQSTCCMDLGTLSFWSHSDFRWVECSRCGIVLGVWARQHTDKPQYRWSPEIVSMAYRMQRDADPGFGYTTGETVKTFCEQCRLQHPEKNKVDLPSAPQCASAFELLGSTVSFVGDAKRDDPPWGPPRTSDTRAR